MVSTPVRLALAAVSIALTPFANAEVKDVGPSGFTVENSAVVPVDAATAWRVLTREVDTWWPKGHTWWGKASTLSIDPRAGGCFCEIAGKQQAQHLQVVFVDPDKLLRMSGGLGPLQGMGLSGTMEFRLTAATGGTRIVLWYRAGGYTTDDLGKFAPVVDSVQAQQLGGLVNRLRSLSGK
jgi:hypothetical protein